MIHPTAQHPNEYYTEGLRHVDQNVVNAIYLEFRRPVARSVELSGGSNADGNTFFRVALIHASMLAEQGLLEEETPVFYSLQGLAVAHFRDWAAEKGMELPEKNELSEDYHLALPNAAQRHELRQNIRAKRQFTRLEPTCKKVILDMAQGASLHLDDPRAGNETTSGCLDKYRKALHDTETEWPAPLPDYVVTALTDAQFNRIWSAAEAQEGRLALGNTVSQEKGQKVTRNVLIALAVLFLGYAVYAWVNAPKPAGEVYKENYHPPTSILADRADRAVRDSTEVTPLPEPCESLLQEADEFYKKKQWNEAADVLTMMETDDTEVCKSDALFYSAIIALQMEEPDMAVDYLTKITDIDRFGEDLYWYQALAFVQIAAHNPLQRDLARRAVERARSNTEIPERRAQAEKMLEQLKD